MKRLPKWLTKIVLVLVLAALMVVLMLYLDGVFSRKVVPQALSGSRPASIGTVQLVEAKLIDVPSLEQAPGTIRPLHETSLSSKVREPEKVVEMNVVAGQDVRKGDLLARLDSSTWENRREMAAAKLKIAQSSSDDAQKNYDRMAEAFNKKVATQSELDSAKYRLEAAQSEVVATQRALDEAAIIWTTRRFARLWTPL